MDFDSIVPLINMLPPQAQIWALNALGLLCMTWLTLLGARWVLISIMGTPQPTDSERKTAVFHAFKWLDLLTVTQLRAMLELSRKEKEIRRLHVPAPSVPPAPPWAEPVEMTEEEDTARARLKAKVK